MRYLLIILGLLLISCELFEEEDAEKGICVFYELTSINGTYINDYSCWNGALETGCNGTWYPLINLVKNFVKKK